MYLPQACNSIIYSVIMGNKKNCVQFFSKVPKVKSIKGFSLKRIAIKPLVLGIELGCLQCHKPNSWLKVNCAFVLQIYVSEVYYHNIWASQVLLKMGISRSCCGIISTSIFLQASCSILSPTKDWSSLTLCQMMQPDHFHLPHLPPCLQLLL